MLFILQYINNLKGQQDQFVLVRHNDSVIGRIDSRLLHDLAAAMNVDVPAGDQVSLSYLCGGNINHINDSLASLSDKTDNPTIQQCVKAWRNEQYPIFNDRGQITLTMERSCVSLFGIRTFGCHLNAYTADGKMWIARRSLTKQTHPGMLDSVAAGGIGADCFEKSDRSRAVKENMIRECHEEAGMYRKLAEQCTCTGAVSFHQQTSDRVIVAETNYTFDLLVDDDFKPVPKDGEVREFMLMSIEEVFQSILNDEFSPSATTVLIDFLIRHGHITPENDPDYLSIIQLLHPSSVNDLPGP